MVRKSLWQAHGDGERLAQVGAVDGIGKLCFLGNDLSILGDGPRAFPLCHRLIE